MKKTQPKTYNKRTAQAKTRALVKQHIIDTLDEANNDNLDHVWNVCNEANHPIDTSGCDVDIMLEDPKVRAAFKKFVTETIAGYKCVVEEFGVNWNAWLSNGTKTFKVK